MIKLTVMSVKEYERLKKEKGFVIRYGYHESPFGKCLIGLAGSRDQICHFSFVTSSESENLKVLMKEWPGAEYLRGEYGSDVVEEMTREKKNFEVMLKGTAFQKQVWEALLKIEKGTTKSYEDVAKMIGKEKAVRAVANAVAKNFVCYFVPCHRVIKKDGSVHKYGWGSDIKIKLLSFENCVFPK